MSEVLQVLVAVLMILGLGMVGLSLLYRLLCQFPGETSRGETHCSYRMAAVFALLMLLSRLMLYAFAFLLARLSHLEAFTFLDRMYQLWIHWDARHYLRIAETGYPTMGDDRLILVFFPLYPWLVRALTVTGLSAMFAGMLLSLAAASVATALLYLLSGFYLDPEGSRMAAILFILNPVGVFFCTLYTEALFLCLTLACVYLKKRGHPWWSAFFGMLSAFTRMPGVIVAGLVLIDLLRDSVHRVDAKKVFACLLQMLIIFSGLFLYWGVNWVLTGDPFTYLTYQKENWYQSAGTFWDSAMNTVRYFFLTKGESDHWWSWGLQLLTMTGAVALLLLNLDTEYDLLAYSFVYLCIVFAPTWLLSGMRYVSGMFTLPILATRLLKRRRGVYLSCCIVLFVLLFVFVYGYTTAVELL